MTYFRFILFFIASITTTVLSAQSGVFPTAEDNPVWTLDYYLLGIHQEMQYIVEEEVELSGELLTPVFRVIEGDTTSYGYYRQSGEKVYFRTGVFPKNEHLLYDFSLQAGDSAYFGAKWTFVLGMPDTILYHIEAVDTVFIDCMPRKVQKAFFYYQDIVQTSPVKHTATWIEGVGDIGHPFYPEICPWTIWNCEEYSALSCYEEKGKVIYASGYENDCTEDLTQLTRIYVNAHNENTIYNNGSCWQQAFTDLQDALAVADYGDSIWVAKGSYFPTESEDREVSFILENGVKLFGGFSGTETTLEERDWQTNPTILSGDIGEAGVNTDNSRHIVYTFSTDSTTLLDGFTLCRGYAFDSISGIFFPFFTGGGLLVDTDEMNPVAEPVIRNCHFEYNTAKYGGAVYCNGLNGRYANPKFINCSFFRNRGETKGGAIYKTGPSEKTQQYVQCSFEENWALIEGGAVSFEEACGEYLFRDCEFLRDSTIDGSGAIFSVSACDEEKITFEHCQFEENQGTIGGAFGFISIHSEASSNHIFIFDSTNFIRNNSRNSTGGALFFAPKKNDTVQIKIRGCSFLGNNSLNAGGGIYIEHYSFGNSIMEIDNSYFRNNYSRASPAEGAIRIRNIFGSDPFPESSTIIRNTLFEGNGGAVAVSSWKPGRAYVHLINCSSYNNGPFPFVKNWSENFDPENYYVGMSFTNCILWEPQAELTKLLYNGIPENDHLYEFELTHCLLSPPDCEIEGGEEACLENNLFGLDPLFMNPESGDLHLSPCSPAVNAGTDQIIDSLEIDYDLDGNNRILHDTVDIGVYELVPAPFLLTVQENIIPATSQENEDGAILIENVEGGWPPYSYYWSTGDTTDQLQNLSPGVYELTITDLNACSQSLVFEVGFTVDTDNFNFKKSVSVFPNPVLSGNELNITNQFGLLSFTLFDLLGNKMLTFQSAEQNIRLSTELLESSTYFMKISDESGRSDYRKIVITR